MTSNQNANTCAINRFGSHEPIEVNANTVYATHRGGMYNAFYASEQEAIDHCSNPKNGYDFKGWIQDSYSTFGPGELFAVVGKEPVYISADRSRYIDAAMGRWQIPFVEWKAESPLAV